MKAMLKGRVGKTPELKTSKAGKHYTNLSVAESVETTKGFITEWFSVLMFGGLAEKAASIPSGTDVLVPVSIKNNVREVNGKKEYSISIIAEGIYLCPQKEEEPKLAPQPQLNQGDFNDSDIPF